MHRSKTLRASALVTGLVVGASLASPGVALREAAAAEHAPASPTALAAPLELAAFPGAQGSGAAARGGRSGRVFVVTSTADAGPGTLRRCVRATMPRTCVFAVGGIIRLESTLEVDHPFLTVAGQTAPGGGILLTNARRSVMGSLVAVGTHDVVWRYTRLRNRYRAACSDSSVSECGGLAQAYTGARRVILDHNSLSWNQDEAYGVWRGDPGPLREVTVSMSLVAEGLASHSTGLIVGGETSDLSSKVTDIDAHHNLVLNNSHRNPLFKGRSGRVVNNLFYNQGSYITQVGGGGSVDVVGNVFRKGPLTGGFHEIQAFRSRGADAYDGTPSLYVGGNVGWHQPDPMGDQWPMTRRVTGENGEETTAMPRGWRRTDPLPDPRHPIVAEPAATIAAEDGSIIPTVGASQRLTCEGAWVANRDSVDLRQLRQLRTGTGRTRLLRHQDEVGGLPKIARGRACADADRDGMADVWETGHGLSPGDAGDRNGTPAAANGYTNLELFLSGLFPTGTPLPSGSPGRATPPGRGYGSRHG